MRWLFAPWHKPGNGCFADLLSIEEQEALKELHGKDWGRVLVIDTVKKLLAERFDTR